LSRMIAAGDGSGILIVSGNTAGTANLFLYDPIADTFPILRTGAVTALRGTVAAAGDGSSYVVDNNVFNLVLGSQGTIGPAGTGIPGIVLPASQAWADAISGNSVFRVQPAAAGSAVQTLQRFNIATLLQDLSIQLPEPLMDININPVLTRLWPTRNMALDLGNQTQALPRSIVADANNNVYLLTLSGMSIVSTTPVTGRAPSFSASGVVNTPSRSGSLSAGGLISIFGSNLADSASASGTPLPTALGGICVTANEVAIPLISTSANEIDAQLPPNLATGRLTLTVRSTKLGLSSPGVPIQVNASGPSLFSVFVDGQARASMFHTVDAALVTPVYPADRDETLVLYASGLGAVDPSPGPGEAGTDTPFSQATQSIGVSIGGRPYEVVSTYLAPGWVGLYAIIIYVPGNRIQGDDLPVVVTAGGVSSDATNAPLASIH
jgi:uncharacterized protein (TIGR03437 family)